MAATQNSQVVQDTNALMALAGQLMTIYQQMVVLDASWTDHGDATVLAALNTTALNADGTVGTADTLGSPNTAHPINLALTPGLTRAVSSVQIGQVKTIMDGLVTYINGSAVTTQAGARAILNAVIGG